VNDPVENEDPPTDPTEEVDDDDDDEDDDESENEDPADDDFQDHNQPDNIHAGTASDHANDNQADEAQAAEEELPEGWWKIKSILRQKTVNNPGKGKKRGLYYEVDWEGIDPETQQPWAPSWLHNLDVTEACVIDWEKKLEEKRKEAAAARAAARAARLAQRAASQGPGQPEPESRDDGVEVSRPACWDAASCLGVDTRSCWLTPIVCSGTCCVCQPWNTRHYRPAIRRCFRPTG